ncbi:MAG TPA: hypothetical protein PLQ93_10410 [Bacteroidia bacterium]|nr:hypothetical protein [Bacteroidia bacterium]
MRTVVCVFIFLVLIPVYKASNALVLVIEGQYQNKNILVQNSNAGYGVGFCAKEIRVNGRITTDETNSGAFEIDLASLHLRFGEKVLIEIIHDKSCTPRILNLEDLFPKPSFETLGLALSPDGVLSWTTRKESGSLPFVIEQFKWNKWIPVGEVDGLGTPEQHSYSFKVDLHSGENTFRLRQKGFNAMTRLSESVKVKSKTHKPEMNVSAGSILFDQETAYEVYDIYGVNTMKGFGKEISLADLKAGTYYLSYDNCTVEFRK